jgi:membrane protease YdiL (CAAX protease family)
MSWVPSTLDGIVDDHPVAVFAPLALLLSWVVWVLVFEITPTRSGLWFLGTGVGAFGPGVAAAVVTRLRGESVRAWLAESFAPLRSLRWYALALAGPVAATIGVAAIVFGFTGAPAVGAVVEVLPLAAFNLVMATILTGGNEEFGWRGFALPHLQTTYSAFTASLLIGGLWTLWHAPLFVYGVYQMPAELYAPSVLAFSVVLGWYYNTSGGSLLGAMLFHGGINSLLNLPGQIVDSTDAVPIPYTGVMLVVFGVFAGLLLVRHGPDTLAAGDRVRPTWTGRDETADNSTAVDQSRSHAVDG